MRIVVPAKEKPGLKDAIRYLQTKSAQVEVYIGTRFDPFPAHAYEPDVDITVSYLSPWIVPAEALKKTKVAAVNFHPGPPEYPGSGCTNFALYDEVREYGVTAHLMEPSVDTGRILMVKRFPVSESDSVLQLSNNCYSAISEIFPQVMDLLLGRKDLPDCKEHWTRKPYTRRELDALCQIEASMTADEVARRVRATTFPGMPGPFILVHGYRFELVSK